MQWKYVKKLKNANAVRQFIQKQGIELPETLIDCLTKNNGGYPVEAEFVTQTNEEHLFKCLLSYNKEDAENIYVFYELFKGTGLYPIGMDVLGNFVCYDVEQDRYILQSHETDEIEVICQGNVRKEQND